MSQTPDGAILQRDKTTYAIVPRTPAGLVTAAQLEALATVVRKFDIPVVKITSGQRMALVGMKEEDLPAVWKELSMEVGRAVELCLHYVQACPGNAVCRFGQRDSLGFGLELEREFTESALPAKVKMGVSGCPLCCGESLVRDVGLIGKKRGWTVAVGGNAGSRPRFADQVAEDMTREEVKALVGRFLTFYAEAGNKRERTARFVNRVGLAAVREAMGLPAEE